MIALTWQGMGWRCFCFQGLVYGHMAFERVASRVTLRVTSFFRVTFRVALGVACFWVDF